MNLAEYWRIKGFLIDHGYADEIRWCEDRKSCAVAEDFLFEYIWVVVNSGMREQIARVIYGRILDAISKKKPIKSVFKHPGKVAAIQAMAKVYQLQYSRYQGATDKIEFLADLPWIGKITKYHLARNLGLDVCKPDRHMVRIAAKYGTTPEELCGRLAKESGDRIGTVDVVLWRAANLGMI